MQTQELPLSESYVVRKCKHIFSRAQRQFGSWTEALIAAGIITKEVATKLSSSRLGVLKSLGDFLESNSKDNISQILRSRAELYFGSLRKAFIALKKDQRVMRGWSQLKLVKILAHIHKSKANLTYVKARRTIPSLVHEAERFFGSWRKALYAAEIDPNSYFVHHRWRKTDKE
jgi:hypothetical protein